MYNDVISIGDFEKFIRKNKLIYNAELFEIFNKYLLFLNKHSIEYINSYHELNKLFEKGNDDDFVSKNDVKNILRDNKLVFQLNDLERLITGCFGCCFKKEKMINRNIFINLKLRKDYFITKSMTFD